MVTGLFFNKVNAKQSDHKSINANINLQRDTCRDRDTLKERYTDHEVRDTHEQKAKTQKLDMEPLYVLSKGVRNCERKR